MLPENVFEGVMQDLHQDLAATRDGLMLLDMRAGLVPGGGGGGVCLLGELEGMKIEPQDICDQEMTVFHHLPQHPHRMLQQQQHQRIPPSPPAVPRIKLRPAGELLRPEPNIKRRPLQYSDLPYMGEMTLDSSKPRRGRKPKKADICHLIYKNYGTTVTDGAPPPQIVGGKPSNATGDRAGSLLERRLTQEESQPLNLCVRDAPQQLPVEPDQLLTCYPMALYYQNLIAAAAAASTAPPNVQEIAPVVTASAPREKTQKRKRSAIFIPPAPLEGATNPATEVSICKFKFTGGAKPSLQEKKMLSVDSGGNFRYFSGTGDKSMRGYEFFPRESLQAKTEMAVVPVVEKVPEQKPSLEHRRKRKSRRSLQRERLEQTFKEKGFLIQTQKLESAEGATYCKFRQLRKFTRYLFRSWKDYLPGELQNGEGPAPGVPGAIAESSINAAVAPDLL